MNASEMAHKLTWVTAQAPLEQFDPLVKKLWQLLTEEPAKVLPEHEPVEWRSISELGDKNQYVYASITDQLFLFQEHDAGGQVLRDVFCAPLVDRLAFGARVPEAIIGVLKELPGITQLHTVPTTTGWPDLLHLREIAADAAAEDELEHTPVAALVAERDYLAAQLAQTADALRHARYEAKSLKAQLGDASQLLDATEAEEAYPESLDDVGQWAQKYSDRMILAERAVRGAKKSLYKNPQTVYECLEHLATRYWEMKTGRISVAAHDAAMMSLPGISLRGSAAPNIAGECGEAYFISHNGRRLFLDLHMAKGGGMDQRYCLRVYFTWLPDEQRVLVGDMPAHLINSLS